MMDLPVFPVGVPSSLEIRQTSMISFSALFMTTGSFMVGIV